MIGENCGTDYRRHWPLKTAFVVAIIMMNAVWIALTDFTFDLPSAGGVILLSGFLGAIAFVYIRWRPAPRLEIMCVETIFLLLFSAAAAVSSYLFTSIGLPLIDAQLMAFDRAIGFDWLAYSAFFNERPILGFMSSSLYMTTLAQVALLVVVLGLTAPLASAGRFVSAVMISAAMCIVISALLPAAGALATIQPPDTFFGPHKPIVDLDYKQAFFDLRNGALTEISLEAPKGLIAFPSYHATLSFLIILACWPIRFLRWPLLMINVLIVFTTPIDGGHHLVDAFGGGVVALIAWLLSGGRLTRTVSPKTALMRGGGAQIDNDRPTGEPG